MKIVWSCSKKLLRIWRSKLRGKAEQAGSILVSIEALNKPALALSPLLFTLYAPGKGRRQEDSKLGFDISHRCGWQVVEQRIPGLIYADDIVSLAGNAVDLERLADICEKDAIQRGLCFAIAKSGVMRFKSEENGAMVLIQQNIIPAVKNFKYLGVTISDGEDYLDDHEEHLRLKGRRNAALMKHRAL